MAVVALLAVIGAGATRLLTAGSAEEGGAGAAGAAAGGGTDAAGTEACEVPGATVLIPNPSGWPRLEGPACAIDPEGPARPVDREPAVVIMSTDVRLGNAIVRYLGSTAMRVDERTELDVPAGSAVLLVGSVAGEPVRAERIVAVVDAGGRTVVVQGSWTPAAPFSRRTLATTVEEIAHGLIFD